MEGPFAPPAGSDWTRVSPHLARMRRTMVVSIGIPTTVAISAGLSFISTLAGVVGAIVAGVLVMATWFSIGRNVRSWGYAERENDLLVTHGAMFKKLTVVPYGRMQLIDVEAGPIERIFGLVRVKLHTAAATTDAEVCGLTPDHADALRNRLTARGEAHAGGL